MPRRFALVALLVLALVPSAFRAFAARPAPPRRCVPEGRGIEPRIWIGCAGDDGPPRGLSGRERLVLGLRIDLNAAAVDDLAAVPGLSPRLAAAIVAERARAGPYDTVDGLLRVRGIGPARLERARPHLECGR